MHGSQFSPTADLFPLSRVEWRTDLVSTSLYKLIIDGAGVYNSSVN